MSIVRNERERYIREIVRREYFDLCLFASKLKLPSITDDVWATASDKATFSPSFASKEINLFRIIEYIWATLNISLDYIFILVSKQLADLNENLNKN